MFYFPPQNLSTRRTYFETFAEQNTPEEMAELVRSWTVASEGKGA